MDDDTIPLIGVGRPDPKTEEDVDRIERRARKLAEQLRKLLPADDDVMTLVVLAQLLGNTLAKQAFLSSLTPDHVMAAVRRHNAIAQESFNLAMRALVAEAAREANKK